MNHHIGKPVGKLVARIQEAPRKWFVRELTAEGLKSPAPPHGDVPACTRGEADND